jgi:hypothetical protein
MNDVFIILKHIKSIQINFFIITNKRILLQAVSVPVPVVKKGYRKLVQIEQIGTGTGTVYHDASSYRVTSMCGFRIMLNFRFYRYR